ncbi:MAG: sensor histidine kinase [Jatrophihabitantaceae bacterium]
MVNEVLDVARIETRALPITIMDVALQPVVAGVLAMVNPLANAERVTLHTTAAGARVCVRADERRARQVLLNLVTNAIRYNRADGAVLVGWTVEAGQVRITVRDTGPGIAAEHLDRLFTPFDRLGRDSEEGVGLGLPLARGLTEAMGGTIEVHSEVDEGTTMTVVLPLAGSPDM